MIGLLVAIALQASTGGAAPSADEQYVLESYDFYRECVTGTAIKLDASNESPAAVVDASVASCSEAREMAKAFSTNWLAKKNPTIDPILVAQAADKAFAEAEGDLRQGAVAAILTNRANRNK